MDTFDSSSTTSTIILVVLLLGLAVYRLLQRRRKPIDNTSILLSQMARGKIFESAGLQTPEGMPLLIFITTGSIASLKPYSLYMVELPFTTSRDFIRAPC